ncbi:MAG: hypothetical protein MUE97_07005 [Phycisphaerales bacterium]|nr:hypothetical protein [Phycisphaerales bacterium]
MTQILRPVNQSMTTSDFRTEVLAAAAQVRSALAVALTACHVDPQKPQALGRQLRLDKSLAWKLARVVTDEDPLAAVCRLPGRAGAKLALSALSKGGASPHEVASVQQALDDLESCIERHCADRETLEMMLLNLMRHTGERHEHYRKSAFLGNAALFGVQARAQIALHVVAPSRKAAEKLDLATISGLYGLTRLRANTPWPVAHRRTIGDDGAAINGVPLDPIDPEGVRNVGAEGVPLMRRFCSPSLPEMLTAKSHDGTTRLLVGDSPLGLTGMVDCVVGWRSLGALSAKRSGQDQIGAHLTQINTPAEVLQLDLLIHRTMDFALHPELLAWSLLPGASIQPSTATGNPACPNIPLGAMVRMMQASTAQSDDIERYSMLIDEAVQSIGRVRDEFIVARVRLEYPPMPTMIAMRYPLPG